MKKIFTLLFISTFVIGLQAQNYKLIDPDNGNDLTNSTLDLYGNAGDDIIKEVKVANLSANSVNMKVKRTLVYNILADDTVEYCWDACYPPSWGINHTSTNPITINSGDTAAFGQPTGGFHCTVRLGNTGGVKTVRYKFYNSALSTDSVGLIINYHSSGVGISESMLNAFTFSNPQPNPSANSTSIKYEFPVAASAKIKLYNSIGGLVKEIKIEDQSGKLNLETGSFANGIYFYSLVVNDKVVGTKKLIISH